MMHSQEEMLLQVCGIAEQYVASTKTQDLDEFTLVAILGVLLDFEHILDSGRNITLPGAPAPDLQEVNSRMDTLRSSILELMRLIGKEKVVQYVESRARSIQSDFVGIL